MSGVNQLPPRVEQLGEKFNDCVERHVREIQTSTCAHRISQLGCYLQGMYAAAVFVGKLPACIGREQMIMTLQCVDSRLAELGIEAQFVSTNETIITRKVH